MAEIAAFREIDVVMKRRGWGEALGEIGHETIVFSRKHQGRSIGEEEGDEGLLKIVARAVQREETGGPPLEFFPVDSIAAEAADADVNTRREWTIGE